ncbi:MAG: hypothetical protein ACLSHU_05970 [Oscillospiraceae bacterium]
MLEPVATRLEALLRPWALRAEPLARSWEARYREGNAVEILKKRACCNAGSSVQALFINLRYLQPTAAPGVLDDEARTVFFTPAWPRRQSERNRWILRTGNTMRCGSWEVLHG